MDRASVNREHAQERKIEMSSNPDSQRANMIQNLEDKTGQSLEAWVAIATDSGRTKHGQIVEFLKSDKRLSHGYANLIALEALNSRKESPLDGQYSGAKADLRPIYEAIAQSVSEFGSDVELSPKKAYVSLRRNKQFGLVQPSTNTRIDVGINLKGVDPTKRLEASGSFNGMVSHRVRITAASEVDDQLISWLLKAYEAA